jgi:peptidoglycan L-alanyl-D-glutamate endopeptidase CwlK
MPSRDLKDAHTSIVAMYLGSATTFATRYPTLPQPFVTCTHRTKDEQKKLYAQGRTAAGPIVTWTLNSRHNSYPSEAIDIAFKNSEGKLDWSPHLFQKFAAIVKEQYKSIDWGGDWKAGKKDLPHFELRRS